MLDAIDEVGTIFLKAIVSYIFYYLCNAISIAIKCNSILTSY